MAARKPRRNARASCRVPPGTPSPPLGESSAGGSGGSTSLSWATGSGTSVGAPASASGSSASASGAAEAVGRGRRFRPARSGWKRAPSASGLPSAGGAAAPAPTAPATPAAHSASSLRRPASSPEAASEVSGNEAGLEPPAEVCGSSWMASMASCATSRFGRQGRAAGGVALVPAAGASGPTPPAAVGADGVEDAARTAEATEAGSSSADGDFAVAGTAERRSCLPVPASSDRAARVAAAAAGIFSLLPMLRLRKAAALADCDAGSGDLPPAFSVTKGRTGSESLAVACEPWCAAARGWR
mmetsp:Transcript_65035/g.209522  ORF Transcript_65035/g.209522 Transcript_65035/m.209522 type:complete len:300 (+) Transcript_65035:1189-2088(+)